MSNKKDNIKYVGNIPCKIPNLGIGKIKPNQTLTLPQSMADNLVRDKNWERIDETPTPPGTKKEKKEKGGK